MNELWLDRGGYIIRGITRIPTMSFLHTCIQLFELNNTSLSLAIVIIKLQLRNFVTRLICYYCASIVLMRRNFQLNYKQNYFTTIQMCHK